MKKYITFIVCVLVIMFFTSCHKTAQIQIQEVYIPIKCDIEMPKRPKKSHTLTQSLAQILKYTETLELALKTCTQANH